MFKKFFHGKGLSRGYDDIDPDEIFLDSRNLPEFDTYQFEGRLIKSISKTSIYFLGAFFVIVVAIFLWKMSTLQIVHGKEYADISENNMLAYTYLFPERGVVFDRNKNLLAWNVLGTEEAEEYSKRAYTATSGLAHILGYVKYPQADTSGNYYKTEYSGETGVEKTYGAMLSGQNGLKIIERDALLNIKSQSVIDPPIDGSELDLTIDEGVQAKLYASIKELAHERDFEGGTGVIMDVNTGEILALTSYPEYDSSIMSNGEDRATIAGYNLDSRKPYLNRAIAGRYTPGSIVKPFVAIGALNEGVVTPNTSILSTGVLTVQNPWHPELSTAFPDWKAHGWVDVRHALAVSSNVYFYEVGGGYAPDNQKGIGITNIKRYAEMFDIGEPTGIDLPGEVAGVIPDPAWKKENFDGEEWTVGDTYHTAIGQYGFLVTPIQMVRAVGGIATDGVLVTPHVAQKATEKKVITEINKAHYRVVREGMRMVITEGTSQALNVPYVNVAAKSGTAELDAGKTRVNSWIVGFFPYEKPRYAFAVVMEKGPRANIVGALYVMQRTLNWMSVETPHYLKAEESE